MSVSQGDLQLQLEFLAARYEESTDSVEKAEYQVSILNREILKLKKQLKNLKEAGIVVLISEYSNGLVRLEKLQKELETAELELIQFRLELKSIALEIQTTENELMKFQDEKSLQDSQERAKILKIQDYNELIIRRNSKPDSN
jgi:chromosome segregation ATPase